MMILTKGTYAKWRKVTSHAVSTWLARGKLSGQALTADGRIHVEVADCQIAKRINPIASRSQRNRQGPLPPREPRKCRICQIVIPAGSQAHCCSKACQQEWDRQYHRDWRANNPDKAQSRPKPKPKLCKGCAAPIGLTGQTRNRLCVECRLSRAREQQRRWHQNHPDKRSRRNRGDKRIAAKQAWRIANPELAEAERAAKRQKAALERAALQALLDLGIWENGGTANADSIRSRHPRPDRSEAAIMAAQQSAGSPEAADRQ